MKYAILIGLYLIISGFVHSQSILVGLNGDIGIINTNSETGVGIGLNGEYKSEKLPFSLRLGYRIYTASFSDEQYLSKHSYHISTLDGDVIYSPFTGSLDLYVGAGLSYNIPAITEDGNVLEVGDKTVYPKNAESEINYNILLGLRFTPERFFSPYIELYYWPQQLKYDIELVEGNGNRSNIDGNTDLNKYLIRLGFSLRIYN